MKPSGIGGMAVMEGVMMKNKDVYAVAVRKPDNEIVVEKSTHKDFSDKVKLFKLPIFRGILAFIDSLVVGVKVLNFSASFFEDDEESQKEKEKAKTSAFFMVLAVILSIVMSVGLFMVLPTFLRDLFKQFTDNTFLLSFIEAMIRLAIFIGYVILAAKMPEIKRVFMYHGAEHKTINCLENGFELTVENVRWQSKQHKRCGTSFMLFVIIISLIVFLILPVEDLFWRVISRIILVPFIAGISYEFIRLAGKSENIIVDILSKPGMWMQGLTTKEPDDAMIEVAIQSVGAVFDWREFLNTSAAKPVPSTAKLKKSQEKSQAISNKTQINRDKTQTTSNKKQVDSDKTQIISNKKQADLDKTQMISNRKQADLDKAQITSNKKQVDLDKVQTTSNKKQVDSDIAKSASNKEQAALEKDKATLSKTQTIEVQDETAATKQSESSQRLQGLSENPVTTTTKRSELSRRNTSSAASIHFKSSVTDKPEDEDDEILKALDKFFDIGAKENAKSGEK